MSKVRVEYFHDEPGVEVDIPEGGRVVAQEERGAIAVIDGEGHIVAGFTGTRFWRIVS